MSNAKTARLFAAAALAAILATPAFAGGPLQVASKVLTEKKTAAADGTTRVALVPAKKVVPGDKVVFVLDYTNTGAQPLGNVVLDNPVPQQLAYRSAAPGSPAPEVSVDGKTYGELGTLRVRTATGGMRAASADDVTNVRWRLTSPITAGSHGQLAFQAVLK
jgi:uncharacterized repeat protein (TIGR01451 family)